MASYHKSVVTEPNPIAVMLGAKPGRKAPLEPIKMFQEFDVDEFLEILNRKQWEHRLLTIAMAGTSTTEILRSWVDEWLDSGKAEDGDDPRRRNFEAAEKAANAAFEFASGRRIGLIGYKGNLEPVIRKYEKTPPGTLRPLGGPRAEDYAREQLVFFLLSPVRFGLAKCRTVDCGAYFLLEQWNRIYPNGTLCKDCKRKRSQESAKAATARERSDVKLALQIGVASRFGKRIRRNPLWYRDETLKGQIAEFLNAKFGDREVVRAAYPKGITGKWVANAKNWKPIEEAAKGGK
jgi:hypothetical protein